MESIYYYGQGSLLIAPLDGAGAPLGFVEVGNVPEMVLTPKGSTLNTIGRIAGGRTIEQRRAPAKSIEVSATIESFHAQNIVRALHANVVSTPQNASITTHALPLNVAIETRYFLPQPAVTIIEIVDSSSVPIVVASANYIARVDEGSIEFINAMSAGPYTKPFRVRYTYKENNAIGLLMSTPTPFALRFSGRNEAYARRQVSLLLHRLYLSESTALPMIRDDLGAMEFRAIGLEDQTRPIDAALGRFGHLIFLPYLPVLPTVVLPLLGTLLVPTIGLVINSNPPMIRIDAGALVTIHYTRDGSTPTTASPIYTQPFAAPATTGIIKAIAVRARYTNSPVASFTYTVGPTPVGQLEPPIIVLLDTPPQLISITAIDPLAVIYFTLDGTTPDATRPIYASPFAAPLVNTTIKAIATRAGFVDSIVTTYLFTVVVPPISVLVAPVIALSDTDPQLVTIIAADVLATIRFTVNGSTPDATSPIYGVAFAPSGTNVTIKAIAMRQNFVTSLVTTFSYSTFDHWLQTQVLLLNGNTTIGNQIATPLIGLLDTHPEQVFMSCAESTAAIHYTFDGSTPTSANLQFTTPFVAPAVATIIKAIAIRAGLENSLVATFSYTPTDQYIHADVTNMTSIVTSTPNQAFHDPVINLVSIEQYFHEPVNNI